ncbi:haloacid dehalogenase [Dyella flava]|nr:haloacid dehalogenase [Dyella flava]
MHGKMKLAIFDFDGTLADTYPVFADSVNVLAVRHGFRCVTQEQQGRLRGMSVAEIMRELELPLWKVPAVLADFRKVMHQRIDEIRPFSDMIDVLGQMLQAGIRLALATSNSTANVKAVLGEALVSRFVALECDSTVFGKAHRLRRILKVTRTDEAEAIYIGDEIRDAEAAAKAGVTFGAVAWGYTHLDALLKMNPGQVFRSPGDMLRLGRTTHHRVTP